MYVYLQALELLNFEKKKGGGGYSFRSNSMHLVYMQQLNYSLPVISSDYIHDCLLNLRLQQLFLYVHWKLICNIDFTERNLMLNSKQGKNDRSSYLFVWENDKLFTSLTPKEKATNYNACTLMMCEIICVH